MQDSESVQFVVLAGACHHPLHLIETELLLVNIHKLLHVRFRIHEVQLVFLSINLFFPFLLIQFHNPINVHPDSFHHLPLHFLFVFLDLLKVLFVL